MLPIQHGFSPSFFHYTCDFLCNKKPSRMLPIWKRGVYNAVFHQVKCRHNRFYSSTSLGANEQWKEDLRSELDSHYRKQFILATLRGSSEFKQEDPDSEPFSSDTSRFQYKWYTPDTPKKGKGEILKTVYSHALFMPGYRAIGKYVDGDGAIASQVPAFEALERFWKQKGKLISFRIPTLA